MYRNASWLLALVGTTLLAGLAVAEEAKPVVKGTLGEQTLKAMAVVESVDVEKRTVTVKDKDGKSLTLEVSDAVRNLPQVKPGDHVNVEYYESLAYEVHKAGGEEKPDLELAGAAGRAKEGEKPAGAVGRQAKLRATIDSIDKDAQTVTLKGPQGNLRTFHAKDPKKLDKVSVGDVVEVTYTEALAVSVQPAPAEPKN